MGIIIQNISYLHSNKKLLFENINFTIPSKAKISIIGKNGSGKSSLLKILNGSLSPNTGDVTISSQPYYVPQHFGQYDKISIAEALGCKSKIEALHNILEGKVNEKDFDILNNDWDIEKKCLTALSYWGIQSKTLFEKMGFLSGGEKTKVFLANILIHKPNIILLDEPSNHLDNISRELLYNFIKIHPLL